MLPSARVATVVLNYRDVDDTLACVRSLRAGLATDQRLIVVDNGPQGSPDAARLAEQLGRHATVVSSGDNLGYAGGNNVGIRLALQQQPEFVWLVNPDLRVEPDTLQQLLVTAGRIRDAGALGPRILHGGSDPARIWFDGGRFDAAGNGATGHVNDGRLEADTPPTGARDTDYVTGACLLLRADAVRHVGLLPEDYFLYFEETDYCRRLAGAGWRLVIDPQARASHHKRSSGELPTVTYVYYMCRNKRVFAARNGIDPQVAMQHFDQVWIGPWRTKIARLAPSWVPVFDELVAMADADARAGSTGRRQDLDRFAGPAAEQVHS